MTRLLLTIKYTTWNPWHWMTERSHQRFCLGWFAAWRIAGIIMEAWDVEGDRHD